jgi:AcrR family transcriptional regulator
VNPTDDASDRARPDSTLDAVTAVARSHPQMGQARVASMLRDRGVDISASGVRYLWSKRGLETRFKRLQALEKMRGNGGTPLTASQRDILRRGRRARQFAETSEARPHSADRDGAMARRELIVAGAAQLFVERGYAGTSMRDIAAQVGLLAGSVYHYYPAKENLFLAVQKEGFRQIIERAERAIRDEKHPWKRLGLACAEHVHSIVAGDAISRVTAIGLFAIHEDALQRRLKRDHDHYENIFRKLIDALPLRADVDRSLIRLTLFGAMNWTQIWYRAGRMSPAEVAQNIVAMLRDGTAAGSTSTVRDRRKR